MRTITKRRSWYSHKRRGDIIIWIMCTLSYQPPIQLTILTERAHEFSNFGEAEQFLFQVSCMILRIVRYIQHFHESTEYTRGGGKLNCMLY